MLKLKFAFCWELPYALARARDADVARRCLDLFDNAPPGERHHRVSTEFCAGALRADFDHYLATGELRDHLDVALQSLERAPITEERAEGMHKCVHCYLSRARSSKLPWWASTLRLQENLQMVEAFGRKESGRFEFARLWNRWGMVAQRRAQWWQRPIRCTVSRVNIGIDPASPGRLATAPPRRSRSAPPALLCSFPHPPPRTAAPY